MPGRRGNNERSIRLHHDGRWEARYSLPDGSRRSIMGKTRAEVAKKLTEALRDLDRGVTTTRNERQTVGAYLDAWLATKKPEIEPSYWLRCEQYIRLHIKPAVGRVAPGKLRAQNFNTLYAHKRA